MLNFPTVFSESSVKFSELEVFPSVIGDDGKISYDIVFVALVPVLVRATL